MGDWPHDEPDARVHLSASGTGMSGCAMNIVTDLASVVRATLLD